MTWMLRNADQRPREIRAIDGIRRKCERWTDVMLGIITTPVDWHQYAHQPERARDFADENAGQASSVRSHMLFRSLRTAYATADYHHSQPVLFHEEVASALVLVLPSSSRFLASSAPIQFRSRAKNRTFRFSRLMANREASQSDQE
ncbi:hypothetical protein [Thalassoroseus pseudoceratinae]|uniref:hypothetical protein n=1 Tax=Thalassoroseus pseudoceratinae TaxID=2713176 RepID=UPI00141F192B|nr:hypothetical protein [Thalassoroseus pseudoceratinae]